MKTATFGAGCFWGVEDAFRRVKGVVNTSVGYAGGTTKNPTYYDVCSERTGHAEVVRVEYDPETVSYEDLLDVFWNSHDPTTPNRQGPDIGSQYRSIIFAHDDSQRASAVLSRSKLEAVGRFRRPIVTEIVGPAPFYRAEEYHQQYHEKFGGSCSIHR
jgi:peptide-methionine (S)-S-oxide reductase